MTRPTLLAGALALAALSLLLPSAPGYDPLAWLVWGREAAALELDTTQGPAWKPLPVLAATAFAPAGEAAIWLWLGAARAAGIVCVLAAALLAARLAPPRRRILAGATAALGLLLTEGFVRGAALGYSEAMVVALALVAVDRHLDGRRGHALGCGTAAALLRPEAWFFLGAYAAFVWLREPRRRPLVAGCLAAVPLLWLGPELWGSGELLRSSERARIPNAGAPALAERPALAVAEGLARLPAAAFALAALAGAAWAVRRQERAALALAAGAVAWVVLVAALSEAGYSGEERYLLPGAGPLAVLSGLGAAAVAAALPRGRPFTVAAGAGAAAIVAATAWLALPGARATAAGLGHAAALHRDLGLAIERAGGAERLRSCGALYAGRYRFPSVAWRLHVPISALALEPAAPGVAFRSRLAPRSPVAPALERGAGFVRVAHAGDWEIRAACGAGEEAR